MSKSRECGVVHSDMVTKMNYPLGVLSAILILFVRVATLSIQLALVISTKDFAKTRLTSWLKRWS